MRQRGINKDPPAILRSSHFKLNAEAKTFDPLEVKKRTVFSLYGIPEEHEILQDELNAYDAYRLTSSDPMYDTISLENSYNFEEINNKSIILCDAEKEDGLYEPVPISFWSKLYNNTIGRMFYNQFG